MLPKWLVRSTALPALMRESSFPLLYRQISRFLDRHAGSRMAVFEMRQLLDEQVGKPKPALFGQLARVLVIEQVDEALGRPFRRPSWSACRAYGVTAVRPARASPGRSGPKRPRALAQMHCSTSR